MKLVARLCKIMGITSVFLWPLLAAAQGTRADYERAEKFLPSNVRHLVAEADVSPHWIEKTARFWYLKEGPAGKEFLLVDAAAGTRVPAFDHPKLAAALSHATGNLYQPNKLPFDTFDLRPKTRPSILKPPARTGCAVCSSMSAARIPTRHATPGKFCLLTRSGALTLTITISMCATLQPAKWCS